MDEEVRELAKDYMLDKETAEQAVDLMNEEGLDEDEAIELAELM